MTRIKTLHLVAILTSLFGGEAVAQEDGTIDLRSLDDRAVIEFDAADGEREDTSRQETRRVLLPDFSRGVLFYPETFGGSMGNRVRTATFASVSELLSLRAQRQSSNARDANRNLEFGAFLCLELRNGRYAALLAMAGDSAFSALAVDPEGLVLITSVDADMPASRRRPGLSYSIAETPYAASLNAWKLALSSPSVDHSTMLRGDKAYPEPFKYLGYCTWEHYRKNFDDKVLAGLVRQLEEHPTPFRWLLVDDGYEHQSQNRLLSFQPDPDRFPNGWEPVAELKSPEGVSWLGVWWHMSGYFRGVSEDHELPELQDHLAHLGDDLLLPDGSAEAANAFYRSRASEVAADGFDFVKVDFQSETSNRYQRHATETANRATHNNHAALESAAVDFFDGMLNCIGQLHINVFKQKRSTLLRFSSDYAKDRPTNHEQISWQSLRNSLWLGMVHWGDYDMFQTRSETGSMMAELRAVGGSPIYVSEALEDVDSAVIGPAVWDDGEILRPLAPGTLLPEDFFVDTAESAMRVFAPLNNRAVAVWIGNLGSSETLSTTLRPEHYSLGGAMLQPKSQRWEAPEHGVLAYDWHSRTAFVFDQALIVELEPWTSRLMHLLPITDGVAVIGAADKYLAPAATKVLSRQDDRVLIELARPGTVTVWSDRGAPRTDDGDVVQTEPNLYEVTTTFRYISLGFDEKE